MKKLFFAAMALATIVSCSKNVDDAPEVSTTGNQTAYLSVSLKADMTRAAVGSFADGTEDETAVENATFYFFDAAGNAYNVDDDNAVEVKAENLTWADGTEKTIDKFSNIVLVIKQHQDTPPAKMVALINVANPADFAGKSLAQLQALNTDFQTKVGFVMSNSVYSENGATVVATEILPENIFTTPDPEGEVGDVYEAPEGVEPVKINVERVAAKVQVKYGVTANEKGFYPIEGENDTFVKVLGWDVTNATTTSYLLKNYAETNLFSPVNNHTFHRSYWALTYQQNPAHGFKFNKLINSAARYYHENTLTPTNADGWFNANTISGATEASQLLVAAQLVDAEGNPKQFAKWYGKEYDCDPEALMAAMVSNAAKQIFVEATPVVEEPTPAAEGDKVFNGITWEDVVFYQVEAGDYNPNTHTGDRRYEVRVKADAKVTYYDATGEKMSIDDVNAILNKIEPAMIWKDGYTYYYTVINHFGDADGMVRNHIYDINITGFKGFGTPVYDPTHVIIPETPEEQEPYHMTAQINVLQWALVSQDVNLGK